MSFRKLAMWFWKRNVNNVEKKWVSTFTVCGFETMCWALCGVKTNECGVETAFAAFVMWIRYLLVSIEVSTCRGSFGGFESTCFQLDRAARIKTTGISYFSCNRLPFVAFSSLVFSALFTKIVRYVILHYNLRN
jgi:hypothetical protein